MTAKRQEKIGSGCPYPSDQRVIYSGLCGYAGMMPEQRTMRVSKKQT
jgi:hypothetical protein